MIRIKHLRKEYELVTPLKDINAEINDGDVISIIGPSGTGKSTLLRCLNGLETPTSGEIIIDGVNVTDPACKWEEIRKNVGMVFQNFNLFEHKTIIENVMMAPMDLLGLSAQEAYDQGMDLLEMVGLASKAMSYPSELSGGQKQRVAIARVLAMKPKTILFDEPTSALDPTMVGEVISVIKNLAHQGYTMLIVTHEMRFAKEVSNRIFLLDEGIVYDDNTPEAIFDNPTKPGTIKFIRRLKNFDRDLDKNFDFIAMMNDITEFGKKLWWTRKATNDVLHVFEEVCMQALKKRFGDEFKAKFSIIYSERDNTIDIEIFYPGAEVNALSICDELSKTLVEKSAKEIRYEYIDGVNHMLFKII